MGAPAWNHPNWPDFLQGGLEFYSQHFNAVEGNTTFYALPKPDLVKRWNEQTPEEFRFCFKFPSEITHRKKLTQCQAETTEFLNILEPLGSKLGPFMLQLPPEFSYLAVEDLMKYLDGLPKDIDVAVELRHPCFFDKSEHERSLNRLLFERGVERVSFDTRSLYRNQEHLSDILTGENLSLYHQELERKPKLNVRPCAFTSQPLVRIMASPDLNNVKDVLQNWAKKINQWLIEDRNPYVFFHVPNERYIPEFANMFRQIMNIKELNNGRGQTDLF